VRESLGEKPIEELRLRVDEIVEGFARDFSAH
jgi:hypothetical protein